MKDLEEFAFHQTAVQHWAEALVSQGVLATSRTFDADGFEAQLERHIAA